MRSAVKSIAALMAAGIVAVGGSWLYHGEAKTFGILKSHPRSTDIPVPAGETIDDRQVESLLEASQTPQVKNLVGLPPLDDPDDKKSLKTARPLIEEMPPIPDDATRDEESAKGVIHTLQERIEQQDKLLHKTNKKIEAYNEQLKELMMKLHQDKMVLASAK